MGELTDVLKNNVPTLIFFCVAAVFALFYLVLVFFYIAREKKRRNAFDVVTTVVCIVALVLTVLLGLCAVFYKFPIEKVSVSGEDAAEFSLFGLEFAVPGFGAVLSFIASAFGIALYSLLLFSLLLFAIIHPLRVLRKKDAVGDITLGEEVKAAQEAEENGGEEKTGESALSETQDYDFISALSEDNLSDTIDEIVTQAKKEVSSSDDVSPYMISEDDVVGGLEMLSDEETENEPEDNIIEDEETDFSTPLRSAQNDKTESDLSYEEETENDKDNTIDEEPEEIDSSTPLRFAQNDKDNIIDEEKTEHVSDYAIPVTVRTIVRHRPAEEPKPEEKKPAESKPVESKPEGSRPPEKKAENVKREEKAKSDSGTQKAKTEKKTETEKADASRPPEPQEKIETKEVEAKQVSSLPVGRRYVVQNRRNVVNMFNEYLNSKDREDKEKLASSLNTIILK